MTFILTKYLTTAFIIVLVSEVAKRNDKIGALIFVTTIGNYYGNIIGCI